VTLPQLSSERSLRLLRTCPIGSRVIIPLLLSVIVVAGIQSLTAIPGHSGKPTMPKRALVLIDIQNDYFPGGKWTLSGIDAAADNAWAPSTQPGGIRCPSVATGSPAAIRG
jgi:hypothetical protein